MTNSVLYLAEVARMFVSIMLLGVMGFQDLKTREISSTLVYTYLGLSVVFFTIFTIYSPVPTTLKALYVLVSILATATVHYALYRFRLVGEGDLFVSIALGLSYSYPDTHFTALAGKGILPPSLAIVLYSAVLSTLLSLYNLVASLRHVDELKSVRGIYRLLLPLLARPVKVRDYVAGKHRHVFPVQLFKVKEDGKVSIEFKLLTGIDENVVSDLRELYAKGYVSGDSYIWVTQGIPFVFFFLLGLVTFLLIGDKLVLAIVNSLLNLLRR